jgi:RNA polymerase sigma-70 factor (ECF subfamily)
VAHDNHSPSLEPRTQSLIRSKIRKLIARAPFVRQFREDLEQDVFLTVHQRTRRIHLKPGERLAYIATLIDNRLIDFLRRAYAEKRDYRRLGSLHVLISEDDGVFLELGQTLAEQAHHGRLRRQTRTQREVIELRHDVATVLRRLPPDLRELAELLSMKSLAEIARDCGIPRTTLQGRVHKLRRIFERANLHEYLPVRRQFGFALRR